jgi:hypothetical protein
LTIDFTSPADNLYMSKLTSIAIGLLTAVAILPASQAMAATSNASSAIQQPAGDLHAQVIFKIGPQIRREPVYNSGWREQRLRNRLDRAREREARARWEADRARSRQYDRRYNPGNYRY